MILKFYATDENDREVEVTAAFNHTRELYIHAVRVIPEPDMSDVPMGGMDNYGSLQG